MGVICGYWSQLPQWVIYASLLEFELEMGGVNVAQLWFEFNLCFWISCLELTRLNDLV